MWLKVVVPLVALAYVGYRLAVALEIHRAKRQGDTGRVEDLRRNGFGLKRFFLGSALVLMVLLVVFVLLETR